MQSLNSNDSPLLSEKIMRMLSRNNIKTIVDLLFENEDNLCTMIGLSMQDVLTLKSQLRSKYLAKIVRCDQIIGRPRILSIGIHSLDAILNGGIPCQSITEIYGLAESGKTQLCIQIAINVARNSKKNVLYVDTKGDFSAIRLQSILSANDCSHEEMVLLMQKIKTVKIWSMTEMLELLDKIKREKDLFQSLGLIIIDSLPSLMFQYLGDIYKTGLTLLNNFASKCKYLAKENCISIICVNIQTRWVEQEASDLENEETTFGGETLVEKKVRCLGKYWQYIPALVLQIEKEYSNLEESPNVSVTIIKSNHLKCDISSSLNLNKSGLN